MSANMHHALRDRFYAMPKWARWTTVMPLLAIIVPIVGLLCAVSWVGGKADRLLYKINDL